MKTSQWFLASLTGCMAASLLNIPLTYAGMGGGSTGGGNTINLDLIEDYAKAVEDLPGFKEYTQPKLAEINAVVPSFAAALEAQVNSLTFYVIPRTIESLPEDQTGLHFSSEQPAYQQNGEVFISETMFNQMSNQQKGQLYLHELVEGYRFTLNNAYDVNLVHSDTRVVVAYIATHPKLDGKTLAQVLKARNFGVVPTQAQLDDFNTWATGILQTQIALTCGVSHVANYAQFAKKAGELYCQRFSTAKGCNDGTIPSDELADRAGWRPSPDRSPLEQYGSYDAMAFTYQSFSFALDSVYFWEKPLSNAAESSEAAFLEDACKQSQALLVKLNTHSL